ncbi:hypothetical protein [Actinomadura sp. HBU206391]|uniref:hypothetical protein n=1 Tax=Actinomadura sp. HBU206391 TaxID=2731692 RepID=UPI001650A2C5|nr:hypothetical protein [Actinomadura sp. HBU206391]MBC6457730.1 hypothetical protein [Actinomadura sp. HBU206391]
MLLIVAGAVVVLLIVAIGVTIGLSGGDDKKNANTSEQSESEGGQAGKAAQNLAAVRALRYNGSFSSSGTTMQTQLSVTKAGSGSGSITVGGEKVDMIVVDGTTYLKAGKSFWRSHGGVTTNPEDYAGKWSRAASSTLDLDVKDMLVPSTIVQRLQAAAPSLVGDGADVNGTPALRVATADGEYYISKAQPHKLLRIKSTGTDTYQFDVTEVAASETIALFRELQGKVRNLTGALDPGVRFLPSGSLKFSNCGSGGCTLKYTVTSLSLSSSSSVRAVLKATIRASGRDLGTCTDTRSVSASKKVNLSCTVTSGGWKSWVRWARSTPGSHRYEARARVVAQAVSAGDVNGLLAKLSQEQQSV